MLGETQRRLLLRLAEFGAEMEKSWDVPRTLSLPGLAEHLGLVRSAIHTPLKELQTSGLIETRSAHVMGGGSRRRTIVHLTALGRERAEALASEEVVPEARGRSVGPLPDSIHLRGRAEVRDHMVELLVSGQHLLLSGLPGVGKTSLARAAAGGLLSLGWRVRWATAGADSDASSIGGMWLDGASPAAPAAIAAAAGGAKTLLVIDEAQELHSRHVEAVSELVSAGAEAATAVLVASRAPSPFGLPNGFEELRLEGLATADAVGLLPEDVANELATEVAKALGGHPLALRLWSPDEAVPEEGVAVQEYVQSTVLARLSEDGIGTLGELSLSPVPLMVSELEDDSGTAELDDSAVLRWADTLVEPHHLIRNVHRAALSDDATREVHSRSAEFWASREGARARRIEVHHRLNSGPETDAKWLTESLAIIARADSAAAAVIIEEAVKRSDDASLRLAAVDLALERGEQFIASGHLEEVDSSPQRLVREARLARLSGQTAKAEELEKEALQDLPAAEAVRQQIAALVRRHDDRLPSAPSISKAADVEAIDISRLADSDRAPAALALDLLRHAIAIEGGDVEAAANARSSLVAAMGEQHPRLALLDLRARLAAQAAGAVDAAREFIESATEPIECIRAIHATLEATAPEHPPWLTAAAARISNADLRTDLASHRRLAAQRWYWRGVLEPSMRLAHWREAISRFKTAECSRAASDLLERLTRSL